MHRSTTASPGHPSPDGEARRRGCAPLLGDAVGAVAPRLIKGTQICVSRPWVPVNVIAGLPKAGNL